MRRAVFDVTVAGTNISAALRPILLGLSVTDNAGSNSDTASIEIDDKGGQIVLPSHGAAVSILLGWEGEGIREVFTGTVDEVRSAGSKTGGRVLSICAKGMDTTGKIKEPQTRHFDGETIGSILKKAGSYAGISEVSIDPQIADIKLPYIDMRSESFAHLGQRLGAMLGGSFRIQGSRATMARRAASYAASVTASSGVNLISWDITPTVGRARYKAAKARAYDRKKAAIVEVEEETGLDDSPATISFRDLAADPDEAKAIAKSGAATAKEDAGGGTIEIIGSADAVPDGNCILTGARDGIDGVYRIKTVTHTFSTSGGWTTSLSVGQPQGSAGKDSRAKAPAKLTSSEQTDAAKKIQAILDEGKK